MRRSKVSFLMLLGVVPSITSCPRAENGAERGRQGGRKGRAHLQRRSVRSNDSLTTFDETLLVPDDVSDLDDIASSVVSEDLDGLVGREEREEGREKR